MAVGLDDFSGGNAKERLARNILPMTRLLPLIAEIELEDHSAAKVRNGWQPSVDLFKEHDLPLLEAGDMVKLTSRGDLLAVAEMLTPVNRLSEYDGNMQAARIVRVFNY